MNDEKLISVIVPVYNTEQYLERCLNSLLEQTYSNLEIIVVNDASTGNTRDIIKKYQSKDKRIVYVEHERNMGLFKARVTGSLKATGEYIAFVDSDDYIGIDFYRLLIEDAEKNQSDMVLSRTVIEENNKVVFAMHDIAFPDEALEGDSVINTFLAQEGRCYSWHTMWNKLYRKTLWDKCLPYYEKQNEHIIMMEDIAFSFPLFYFAKKVTNVKNSVYYYCQNRGSSTDSKSPSFKKFEKNLGDIFKVFEFVKDFLEVVNVSDELISKYYEFRNYYLRDWKKGIENIANLEERQKLYEMFEASFGDIGEYVKEDRFFRMTRTLWNDQLEEIKKKIWNPQFEYISFDIFDTLITRPFYRPTDLFYLLDKVYEEHCKANVSFHQIRIDGEIAARSMMQKKYPDYQDVNIDEIYEYIRDLYCIPDEICNILKAEEKNLEIQFCNTRKTIKELYDFALYAGKKIILISDMYLDEATIKKILRRNGYENYSRIFLSSKERQLKHTGDLFRTVLDKLKVSGNSILHMGDNYYCDILKGAEIGLNTVHIPRTINIFENKVKGFDTGECSTLAQKVSGVILDRSKLMESIGYGSMVALAANNYFDNPFRPFNDETDYNADPYFIGYYALGMHLAGLIKWILQETFDYKRILFMARDGFLVKKAYDIWASHLEKSPISNYIYASRKMLLPVVTESPIDFMNLPIEYNQYSPSTIIHLLNYCTKEMTEEDKKEIFKSFSILEDKNFESKFEYQKFMKFYLEIFYDKERHIMSKELLRKYYKEVKETDIAFDMGYSGSNQNAFVQLVDKPIDVLYVHSDAVKSMRISRKEKFKIKTFYDFSPAISGLLREHILSDYRTTCIGVIQKGKNVIPVFENNEKPFLDVFIINKLHSGALQFIKDYCNIFKEYFEYLTFKSYEVSLPFEAFLRIPKAKDSQIFEGSYFEDKVYGRKDAINIAKYMEHQYKLLPQYSSEDTNELFRNAFIDNLRFNRKLVCFGTGKICREILAEYPDLPVSYFIDNDKNNNGKLLDGKEIKHPENVSNWTEIYIVITTVHSSEIEKQLKNLGLLKYKNYINFQDLFKLCK